MSSFIIVRYLLQVLGRWGFFAPPHLWAAPKRSILNKVEITCKNQCRPSECFFILQNCQAFYVQFCADICHLSFRRVTTTNAKVFIRVESLDQDFGVSLEVQLYLILHSFRSLSQINFELCQTIILFIETIWRQIFWMYQDLATSKKRYFLYTTVSFILHLDISSLVVLKRGLHKPF